MRNYIELNGRSSNEITGLLIQSLPPITKPRIRTLVEEIDGRDGDIVTKLGYSAYDKEISIGLHGEFDIDEVIEFFNSEGTITFSNEPDKYYRYQITEGIDFEKLLRFKTAAVTIHVQPFKYPKDTIRRTCDETATSVTVRNDGNIYARPKITVYGTGDATLSLNGTQAFAISLEATEDHITIDTEAMDAYTDTLETLRNRDVDGDYPLAYLKVGCNRFEWTGNITKIEIENYTRWV